MRLTTAGLASARLRRHWMQALAQVLGVAAAVGLAVTVPLIQSVAAEAGLQSVIANLGSKSYVTIEQLNAPTAASYAAFESDTAKRVRATTGDQLLPGARFLQGPKQTPFRLNDQPFNVEAGDVVPELASWEDLAAHVTFVKGAAAASGPDSGGIYPFTLSADGAHDFTLANGDVMCFNKNFAQGPRALGQPKTDWCGRVAGIWTPRDARDPYWAGTVPAHSLMFGMQSFFGLIAYLSQFSGALGRSTSIAGQTWRPSLHRLHAAQITAFSDEINQLRGYFAVRRDGLFATGIDTGVKDFRDRYAVASFTIQMVAAALLLIAMYSMAFVTGHYLEAQGPSLAVLRGRGWSRRRVWLLLMLQFTALAVLGIPAGLIAAWLLVRRLGQTAFGGADVQLDRTDLAPLAPFALALLLTLLAILVVSSAAASGRSVLAAQRAASRQEDRPWWRWRNLDLIGAVLAVPILAEVQLRGSGAVRAASTSASDDPLAIGLPALALALLALASLRLLPLAAGVVHVLGRRLPGRLAAWQLDRRPVLHARLAMLMIVAAAVGLFATIYSSTDRANTADRTAYEAGADLRFVVASPNTTPPNLDLALAGLPGVAATSTAFRSNGSPGRTNLDAAVLGIDPGTFGEVAWSRADLASAPMAVLTQRLVAGDPDGVRLPGLPAQLSIWVWSSGLGGDLTARVVDAAGRACTCALGSLGFAGERVLTTSLDFGTPAIPPLRLRGLEVSPGKTGPQDGELALGDLRVAAGDGTSMPVEAFEQASGWWQESEGPISGTVDLSPSFTHPRAGHPTAAVAAHLFQGTLELMPAPGKDPLPALVSAATLRGLGVGLGQPFPMHVDTAVLDVVTVGVVDYFPTFYPSQQNFLVLPRDSLLGRLGHEHYGLAWPNEAWLKLKGDPAPVVTVLRNNPDVVAFEVRDSLLATALDDPLRRALQATLAVGFGAALAMAVVGFGLHFLVAARERQSEYAILRANGMPARLVQRSLAAEQLVLLTYSLAVGAALALLMAWVILPSVQVSADPTDLVPPTIVSFDRNAAALVLAAVLGVAFLAGQLASRIAGRLNLLEELRLLG